MVDAVNDDFQEDIRPQDAARIFLVDLDGYEGPLDVLLSLARDHKLDLTQISILALADQYLAFITEARKRDLEIAADYLVMAAWLAYLKSRLLLPDLSAEDEPTGEEMAAALAFQIRRLEAMQDAGAHFLAAPRLGVARLARGEPEDFPALTTTVLDVTLNDLLQAYARIQRRAETTGTLKIEPFSIYTVEDALKRLRNLIGATPSWAELWKYLPDDLKADPLLRRSAVASTFVASLELAKEGKVRLRQSETFGQIFLKAGEIPIEDETENPEQGEGADDDRHG